jgi:hypothetical protein
MRPKQLFRCGEDYILKRKDQLIDKLGIEVLQQVDVLHDCRVRVACDGDLRNKASQAVCRTLAMAGLWLDTLDRTRASAP